ncbi:calcitonin/calcitonin-related polypeptide, alpha [Chanos chanos]|uniref:Calcitonin/calcitonin-related polypeptide, alpha n=1 Tax=Chanos chanos TaxID=29144 RepID=A0A6J2UPA6_CHACN|nr:calcitonin-1-like [Chanos chanos]
MVMLKISAFLLAYTLIICQMYSSNAAPARNALESFQDQTTLSDHEARRLLNAIIREFMHMAAEDLEQETNDEDSLPRPMSKRCCNLSTCVLGKLSQELHRLQSYPRTNVGAGTPGKRRSVGENNEFARFGELLDRI